MYKIIKMTSVQTPHVILIDLDGTIQGDVAPQLREYNLLRNLKLKISTKKSHINDYIKGLLRPYFIDFIRLIKSKYDNKVELFIYTASDKTWAHYIVPIIESIIGFKFNRPIFTRDHCLIGRDDKVKSIKYVKSSVIKTLQAKHGKIVINERTLEDKIVLIDNNYVLAQSQYLVKCPTYDKAVFLNILRNIPKNVIETRYSEICRYLLGVDCSSEWEFMKLVYDDAFKKFIYYENKNTRYEKDKYWKKVIHVFVKHEFNMKLIIKHLKTLNNIINNA